MAIQLQFDRDTPELDWVVLAHVLRNCGYGAIGGVRPSNEESAVCNWSPQWPFIRQVIEFHVGHVRQTGLAQHIHRRSKPNRRYADPEHPCELALLHPHEH